MNWYLEVLKKYTEFTGRARRTEYWMFTLVNFIIYVVLMALTKAGSLFGILYILYALAVLLPSLAVIVRRLHDIGKSGWWILVSLVPFVGIIVLLVFMVLDSEDGANQYGASPK